VSAGVQPDWSASRLAQARSAINDTIRLRMLGIAAQEAKTHLDVVLEERDACAARLRAQGVAMIDIARWARVSDSYLSRRLLRRGLPRRTGLALPPGERDAD